MTEPFKFKVVTPESAPINTRVEFVKIQGASGEIGIWGSHTPTLSLTKAGEVVYRTQDSDPQTVQVPDGILHITENEVTLLVDSIS